MEQGTPNSVVCTNTYHTHWFCGSLVWTGHSRLPQLPHGVGASAGGIRGRCSGQRLVVAASSESSLPGGPFQVGLSMCDSGLTGAAPQPTAGLLTVSTIRLREKAVGAMGPKSHPASLVWPSPGRGSAVPCRFIGRRGLICCRSRARFWRSLWPGKNGKATFGKYKEPHAGGVWFVVRYEMPRGEEREKLSQCSIMPWIWEETQKAGQWWREVGRPPEKAAGHEQLAQD